MFEQKCVTLPEEGKLWGKVCGTVVSIGFNTTVAYNAAGDAWEIGEIDLDEEGCDKLIAFLTEAKGLIIEDKKPPYIRNTITWHFTTPYKGKRYIVLTWLLGDQNLAFSSGWLGDIKTMLQGNGTEECFRSRRVGDLYRVEVEDDGCWYSRDFCYKNGSDLLPVLLSIEESLGEVYKRDKYGFYEDA